MISQKISHSMLFILIAILSVFSISTRGFSGAQLSIDGSQSSSHLGLLTKNSAGISASLSFDLGEHFRISYKHKQEQETSKGYSQDEKDAAVYKKYDSTVYVVSNALNLILVLYSGEVFVPYVFVGGVHRTYTIDTEIDGQKSHDTFTAPSPNGGAAALFRFSQKFMFKVTHTLSLGVHREPNAENEQIIDSSTELGIQYSFN